MPVTFVSSSPTGVTFTPTDDHGPTLRPEDVEHIAEIFRTPLVGAYAWNYTEADSRIRKLYKLGKERNWDAELDVDWSRHLSHDEWPVKGCDDVFPRWEAFESLPQETKVQFSWHYVAWMASQFLHGEQGALLVASQLVSCAPTYDAKLYAASQTFDEARHVEVVARYLREHVGVTYAVNPHLKALLDKVLTDERWDLKFIGMQLIIEALGIAAMRVQREMTTDPLLRDILDLIVRDEARHVAFGVHYMEQFVKTLTVEEREQRAQFAHDACCVMRERLVPMEVFEQFGLDPAAGREHFLASGQIELFRAILFTRIMPNLSRVGLLTDAVKPKFDALGLLRLATLPDDGVIDWAALEAPMPTLRSTSLPTR